MPLIHTPDFPSLYYRKVGEGPVLVLLHGFPESGTLWNNIVPSLSASYMVLIPDLPGSGESTYSAQTLTMDTLAESVKAILDNERVKEAVIAGHSMGGYVALAFANKFAKHVKGLSLVHSIATADSPDKKENRRRSIELIQKGGKDPFVRQMIPTLFSTLSKSNQPDLVENQIKESLKIEDKSVVAFLRAMMMRPDRTEVLTESLCPFQFIIGKSDNVMPFNITLQQSHLSNSNFVSMYSGCGHMSMLENPEVLCSDLDEFIKYCFQRTN